MSGYVISAILKGYQLMLESVHIKIMKYICMIWLGMIFFSYNHNGMIHTLNIDHKDWNQGVSLYKSQNMTFGVASCIYSIN